ncbi:MAG: peroxiredoxin [Phycisphaeraceae bacterium]|nr:MAG: peroxiredoxin [Phycisphaeraceae bacterium]
MNMRKSCASSACAPVFRLLVPVALASMACATATATNRTYDGTNNNLTNTNWGAANTQVFRRIPSAYSDGLSGMARQSGASPRDISNAVSAQTGLTPNARFMSDMVWQWGQFIDHDLGLTPENGFEPAPIMTSPGDPHFMGTPIGFTRSIFDPATGATNPRQQVNEITAYIDGSMVYGSDATVGNGLRTGAGGRLLVSSHSTGDMMPFNTMGLPNDIGPMGGDPADFFVAGDVRANEQSGLTAMHTLWVREHNRWADQIASSNPGWNDEQVYQRARKIVGAQIQKITYEDWIPALMGDGQLSAYSGYDPDVNAGVSNIFAHAAFRVGHTMLSPTLARLDESLNVIPEGNLDLRDAFFDPGRILNEGGIDPILRGLSWQAAQEIDTAIVDDVRNFLFGPPGAGGFDLAALNIQRGRDHGLPDYNTVRTEFGLAPVSDFSDITSDPDIVNGLASVYTDVNEIDPWVGLLAEDHVPGASIGETLIAVLLDQFERSRDGDRFWYQNDPELADVLSIIESTTLGDVIRLNTGIDNLPDNVFFIPTPGAASLLALVGIAACRRRRS